MSALVRLILEHNPSVAPLTNLLEQVGIHKQLATIVFVASQCKHVSIAETVLEVVSRYPKIYQIVRENGLCLPEEELIVERMVNLMSEEMTTSSAVDSATPRIKTQQTVDGDEDDSPKCQVNL